MKIKIYFTKGENFFAINLKCDEKSKIFRDFYFAFILFFGLRNLGGGVNVSDEDTLQTQVGTDNAEINFTADITLTQTLQITKSVTINGNGHTLSLASDKNGSVIKINDNNSSATVSINDLIITGGNNNDSFGGGIWADKADKVSIKNCVFSGNKVTCTGGYSGGGAIFSGAIKNIEVSQCTFINNEAIGNEATGGGMYINCDNNTVSVTNCTFTGNKASNGGGLLVYYSETQYAPTINYCTFVNNAATNYSYSTPGSEIYYNSMAPTVKNSIIFGTYANVTLTNCITLTSAPTSETVLDKSGKIQHTVFRNSTELKDAIGKGNDTSVTVDQLGNTRSNPPSIGAVEIPKVIQSVALKITPEQNSITVKTSETKTLAFNVTATETYQDGSTGSIAPNVSSWKSNNSWPSWINIVEKGSNKASVEIKPELSASGTKTTCGIAAEWTAYNAYSAVSFDVTVEAAETFKPGSLTFDKAKVTMTGEPGESMEDSVNVYLKLYGSNDTFIEDSEITDEYELKCDKISGPSWVTASVEGKKITFKAAFPSGGKGETSLFKVYVTKDGKNYLQTSYMVVAIVSKITGYQVTAAPAEITALAGEKTTQNLSSYVLFEKIFENKSRQAVTNPNLTFSLSVDDSIKEWIKLDSDGTLTLNPGTNTEIGEYSYKYSVIAEADGNTFTEDGTLIVNVVKEGVPSITTGTLPAMEANTAYSAELSATGVTPITWSHTDGIMPEGLNFDENGKLSGTPAEARTFTFTLKAANDFGSDKKTFTIKIADQKPSKWHLTRSVTASKGKWHAIFNVKNGTNVRYYDESKFDSKYLRKVIKTNGTKAGEGNIRFNLLWPNKYEEHTYDFKVKASNTAGTSTYTKSITAAENTGNLSSVATASDTGVIIAGDDDDDGVETFEEYTEGQDNDYSEDVTYFTNGGVDEDGNISVVIGSAASGVDGGTEYVFATVADMLSSLSGELEKIVSIEFRKGSAVDVNTVKSLANLSDISIDECDLTELNLSGMTKLNSLSVYGCTKLIKLDVSGCSGLTDLNVEGCTALDTLILSGCFELDNVNLSGSAVTEIDLSNCPELASVNLNGCSALESLNISGCPSLENLSLNETALTKINLSTCTALKSLSLSEVSALMELTLPSVEFEDFTLTESLISSLTLNGGKKLTSLNLSGNAGMLELNLKNFTALTELDVSNCGIIELNLSGCPALEKLNANGCSILANLNLEGCDNLQKLFIGGCNSLRSLDASSKSLGCLYLDGLKWLTDVDCSGQFIGGVSMLKTMSLENYAGNDFSRVSSIKGYSSDGAEINLSSWNSETGIAEFSSVPSSVTYNYDTGLYKNIMDVTLSGSSKENNNNNGGGGGCNAGRSEKVGSRKYLISAFLLFCLALLKNLRMKKQ